MKRSIIGLNYKQLQTHRFYDLKLKSLIKLNNFDCSYLLKNQLLIKPIHCLENLLQDQEIQQKRVHKLLMPKLIQPKRLNKNITVEEYWSIRDQLKKPKSQPIVAYREDQVANRFRYLKPTEQAKLFNPLGYFFKRSVSGAKNKDDKYDEHFKDQESTFTHEYLSSVRYRVSSPLIPIKKLVFGLKSIIYNHEAILERLVSHLECEDSWPLMQAVTRDIKQKSFDFWMKTGLQKLAYQSIDEHGVKQSIYSNHFNQSKFQNLFDTLSIIMQANYEQIMLRIREFFTLMNTLFFHHHNKYIRTFSMKCVSYIINNLSLEDNLNLIFNIVISGAIQQQQQDGENQEIPICELLLNRHKAVKGCLSSIEINNVIETLKQLPLFVKNNFQQMQNEGDENHNENEQKEMFKKQLQNQVDQIISSYIAGIMDLLETKFGKNEENESNEILFDLNYCIKAFIALQQKSESSINQLTLLTAFATYLQNCDEKRFLTHNQKHQNYINETFSLILGYLQNSTNKTMEQNLSPAEIQLIATQTGELIKLSFKICPQQTVKFLHSKGFLHYSKLLTKQQSLQVCRQINSTQLNIFDMKQTQTIGEFLLMVFSKFFKDYFDNVSNKTDNEIEEMLYLITIVLKKIEFEKKVNLDYLGLDGAQLITKAQSISQINSLILFCKLCMILNLNYQSDETFKNNFSSTVKGTFDSLISPFVSSLETILSSDNSELKPESIFAYENHIKNLLKYSHHEVQWVNVAFSMEECYKQLMRKLNIQKSEEKGFWQDLSLNRIVELDHKQSLNDILNSSLGLLQSRNRLTRKSVLERIVSLLDELFDEKLKTVIERLLSIDMEEIDLDNERDVKKEFVTLEQQISTIKSENDISKHVITLITNWVLGFSFTGFKLINDSIISFNTALLDLFPSECSETLFPFLSYYIYRHSRQFEFDMNQNDSFVLRTPKSVEFKLNVSKNSAQFFTLMKEDFNIQCQNTIEWIGLERIALAIGKAKRFKNKNQSVKLQLENFLKQYFNIEFFRKHNTLSAYKHGSSVPNSHMILQPKTRFLSVMLKLCPETYLPPYQCLHYVSPEYFCLESTHIIKKNRWQALWVKKLKGSKSKEEITDTVNTTIALQKMSMPEQELYAHFLWKQLLETNQQKRRTIFEHIRDRVPDIIPYIFNNIFYKEMLFVNDPEQYFLSAHLDQRFLAQLKERLAFENKKTLLNMMYLLKAMIVVFKSFLRDSIHMRNIVCILRCLIRLVYEKPSQSTKENENKNDQQDNNQNEIEQNDEGEENEEQEQGKIQQHQQPQEKDSFSLYKPHRKELYKVLTEVFTHFTIDYDQADFILSDLGRSYLGVYDTSLGKDEKVFSKIAYASVNSVPGILILLKVISQESFYHHLLVKFGVLDLAAAIFDITDFENSQQNESKMKQQEEMKVSIKKKQSNPHAINTCIDILSNIFNINYHSNKMAQQCDQQNYFENHWHNWTTPLSNLLKSINHYLLFSKNLSQKSNNNKSSYAKLDYYSSENKQNLKSIQNNRNRSKKEMSNHQHQGRNLDLMWQIVGKIVCLGNNSKDEHKKQGHHARIHLDEDWEQIFWGELNKLMKVKQFKDKQFCKLFKVIEICLIYFNQQIALSSTQTDKKAVSNLEIESFLCKIISVLPHINQLGDRIKLTEIINKGIKSTCKREHINLIDEQVIITVSQINSVKKNGLNIEIDYDQFFGSIGKYCVNENGQNKQMVEEAHQGKKEMNLLSHQYVIYNLLPYLTSQELSVRKAVREALNSFLIKISFHLETQQEETLKVYNSVLRLLIEQLKRNEIDNVFWSIFGCIGLFVRFQVMYSDKFAKIFENEMLFNKMFKQLTKVQQSGSLTFESQSEEDFFHLVTSISQGNKMKALKMLKQHCIKLKQENIQQKFKQQEKGSCLPHPLPLLLSVLQHLIMPTKHFTNQHQYNVQGNLTSTLTHISLEIYEVIIPFARESLIKKELKRLSTKIKFNEQQKANDEVIKKNILVIKIISSIVEGIDTLEKCTGNIKKYITDYGFDEFHTKLIQNARTLNQQQQDEESDNEQEEEEKKKVEFTSNLQELESQQAINRNFMLFDRKLLEMEEKEKRQQEKNGISSSQSSSLISFLKLHILIPFKLMLFYENKTTKEAKQEEDKSRMMISVAITKLLIKFPMDMFLFEFQKILSKICRLLKKRKLQIRQNGRKSLCQIAKIVGPQMLYAIVLELKFHLRDNFQKHIFNYTAYQIIQSLSPLNQGELDYCLPLILPMIVDEMFGQAMEEKKMVEANEVPVLNMETKKKKGHELLILITKQISIERIRYLIEYLEKFLKEYLNSQANLSKYEIMVNNLTNGLGHNQQFTNPENAGYFGQILCDSMYELRKQIKIYNFEEEKNKIVNETTLKINTQKSKKIGKESLLLQQQAGRNGSIFKKMTKEVYEKRTQQIMINCLVQFYLALGSLLIKKQVISLKTLDENSKLAENFIKIMQFVFECMDHRDNRIVCKSMRMLHQALIINYERAVSNELKESTKSLRKKVSRKILLFIQKLTSNDAQLLKQSFVILIDLFTQVTITKQFLPSIITIIKLHTNNESEQANIPEPYRLLKLIIYKLPESIYDPLVYQMYQLARINVVNSVIKEIRDCCRQIASTYVKSKQYLQTGLQLSHNLRMKQKDPNKQKHKKQLQKTIQHEYKERIQKELTFYLSNLDCKREQNQQLVLEIIEEWINNRTKQEVEEVSELVMLTLATSLVNGNECIDKVTRIIHEVLKIINKAKIYEIVEKCLVWISQQREKSMIRQCGYFLLHSIVQTKSIEIDNPTVKAQYLLKSTSTNKQQQPSNLLNSINKLLNEQCEILNDYIAAKKAQKESKHNIQNKQWSSIINAIDTEQTNLYVEENKILCYSLELLTCLVQCKSYQEKIKDSKIVCKVWNLLRVPMRDICAKAVEFLRHVDLLAVHLTSNKELHTVYEKHKVNNNQQQHPNSNTRLEFNFRSTISTLINNEMPKQVINQLLQKFISEQQTGEKSYIELFLLLSSLLTALVTKFKAMEQKAQTIYYLLTQRIIKNEEKNELIFKNQQNETKIIDSLGKVSRNQFVSMQCKTLNEQAINLVKEIIGTNEFYRKLTKLQSERRQKKSEQKVTLARLAVTDQKAYQDAKAKKKVKTNNL